VVEEGAESVLDPIGRDEQPTGRPGGRLLEALARAPCWSGQRDDKGGRRDDEGGRRRQEEMMRLRRGGSGDGGAAAAGGVAVAARHDG